MTGLPSGRQAIVDEMKSELGLLDTKPKAPPPEPESTPEPEDKPVPASELQDILPVAEPAKPQWRSDHEQAANAEVQNAWQIRAQYDQVSASLGSAELKQLEQDDPGRAALARQKLMEARSALHAQLNASEQNYRGAYKSHLNQQVRDLGKSIHGWDDPRTMARESRQLGEWLKGQGYGNAELSNLLDARDIKKLYGLWQEDKALGRTERLRPGRRVVPKGGLKAPQPRPRGRNEMLAKMKQIFAEGSKRR